MHGTFSLKSRQKKMPDWTKKALFKGGFGQVDPNFLELPCGENVHYSDFNEYAKYHLHCVIISNRRCRQLTLTRGKDKSVLRREGWYCKNYCDGNSLHTKSNDFVKHHVYSVIFLKQRCRQTTFPIMVSWCSKAVMKLLYKCGLSEEYGY